MICIIQSVLIILRFRRMPFSDSWLAVTFLPHIERIRQNGITVILKTFD